MRYHLIGIGGTGMGALAGLLKQAGHDVRGSDSAVYPPMSGQLEALNIPIFEGFDASNLDWAPDTVVVGNVCSKDHVEVLAATERGLTLTSMPAVLGEEFLANRHSIVVAGTHGKTTTASIAAHILWAAGRKPGLFVGGVPLAVGRGFTVGRGDEFVVEGDEYDTAFFDKGSKFLHYRPTTAILSSVELDHVDIFSSFDEIRATFEKFVKLIPESGLLVVNAQSEEALAVAKCASCRVQTYGVERGGGDDAVDAEWVVTRSEYLQSGRLRFDVIRNGELFDTYESLLIGTHNLANLVAAIAVAADRDVRKEVIRRGVSSFAGVRRRQEFRGIAQGVWVIDDYAHHPTAVAETLRAMARRYAGRRVVALYEPRSATSRRNTFQDQYVDALTHADVVVIGALYAPDKIPEAERFDPDRLALELHQRGVHARYIDSTEAIISYVTEEVRPGDVVVLLSSGSFDGLHDRLLAALGDAIIPARRKDMDDVRSLRKEEQLEPSNVHPDEHVNYLVLRNENGFAGCVALDVFGEEAILRSLAVRKSARGVGYGWMLADTVVQLGRGRGVRRIYLMTDNASDFFAAKLGFRVVDLSTVPPVVTDSRTFEAQAERHSIAMRLDL